VAAYRPRTFSIYFCLVALVHLGAAIPSPLPLSRGRGVPTGLAPAPLSLWERGWGEGLQRLTLWVARPLQFPARQRE